MELPKRERTLSFSFTGESGTKYEGQFTVKCRLNVAEKYQLELEKSKLTSDMVNPSQGLMGFAIALSTLRVKITDAPEWWKQSRGLIEDEDALIELYNLVETAALDWRKELDAKAKEAAEKLGK
jgi:hypothetical protein